MIKSPQEIEDALKRKREQDRCVRENLSKVADLDSTIKQYLNKSTINLTRFSGIPAKRAEAMAFIHLTMTLYNKLGLFQNMSNIETMLYKNDVRYSVGKL
jgi:hypothetical protein